MSSPEPNKEDILEDELSSGVKVIADLCMYILSAPFNLVREISMSLVSMKRDSLNIFMYITYGFHGLFILWDLFGMVYRRTFDLTYGYPPIIVKILSMFLSFILFQFIIDRVYSKPSIEKMDIKMSDSSPEIKEVELCVPPNLPGIEDIEIPSVGDEDSSSKASIPEVFSVDQESPDDIFAFESIPPMFDNEVKPVSSVNYFEDEDEEDVDDEFIRILYGRDD